MSAAAITTTKVTVGEYEFQLNESGDRANPAVLFLHGSGPGATGLSNWRAVLNDMGDEYYCLAPDVIGFGDSTHPDPAPQGLDAFTELRVQTLIGLLDALELERATFVGNSMGAVWSLGLALQAPQRADKIVLMGGGGAPGQVGPAIPQLADFYADPTVDAMETMLQAFVYDPAQFGGELRQIAEDRMPHAMRPEVERSHRATFAGLDKTKPWALTAEQAASIAHDVLVIHGREDRFVPFQKGQWFFENMPNARLYGIGKCGHWTQIEQHERFVTAVRAFLAGHL
ncbi:alpha/beta fold hydrolase [Nocardia vinacea]|uniref:Alpha/beta fold hydrolase n=1 Tax=Nocardia vinacea TaxID=96468 RepID=A0ABZ1YTC7_9NOCA|nr:alpha/beta hydrolase [Nocardia vinacea]